MSSFLNRNFLPAKKPVSASSAEGAGVTSIGDDWMVAISADEAERSVKLLVELGYIKKRSDGTYKMMSTNITTGPQIRSVAVSNYHNEMLNLASQSIERFTAAERNITSQTLSLSDESIKIAVEKLNELRKELFILAEEDKKANRVMQINFQIFPLSSGFDREVEQ